MLTFNYVVPCAIKSACLEFYVLIFLKVYLNMSIFIIQQYMGMNLYYMRWFCNLTLNNMINQLKKSLNQNNFVFHQPYTSVCIRHHGAMFVQNAVLK